MPAFDVTVPVMRRPLDDLLFADLNSTIKVLRWRSDDGRSTTVTFDTVLTDVQVAAVKCRMLTPDAATEALFNSGVAALIADTTFLAITAPTNPQVLAQVQALTRQAVGLLHIALGF